MTLIFISLLKLSSDNRKAIQVVLKSCSKWFFCESISYMEDIRSYFNVILSNT